MKNSIAPGVVKNHEMTKLDRVGSSPSLKISFQWVVRVRILNNGEVKEPYKKS